MRAAGYIDAERLPYEEVERLCLARLHEGVTLVFFPEGERSRSGALGRFHAGAFAIAVRAHRPVIPMLIYNSFTVFRPGARAFTPHPIQISLFDPIDPADFLDHPFPHRSMMRFALRLYQEELDAWHRKKLS